MRRILPSDRSTCSGSTTSTSTLTPIVSLMRACKACPAVCATAGCASGRRSTRTVSSSQLTGSVQHALEVWRERVYTEDEFFDLGREQLTPRKMIMSSVRPVIFSMRRMVRAVPGISRVRSRVR